MGCFQGRVGIAAFTLKLRQKAGARPFGEVVGTLLHPLLEVMCGMIAGEAIDFDRDVFVHIAMCGDRFLIYFQHLYALPDL